MDGRDEILKLDYEQTLATYRQLVDIRFKLLAFVPTLSGVAVALLTTGDALDRWGTGALASLGFLVTLGIVLYDQRNTQYHNGAITRAQFVEKRLKLEAYGGDREVGLFGSRKEHKTRRLFGIPIGHDLGLAFVYSPVLGAWVFAAVYAGGHTQTWVAVVSGSAVGILFFVQFLWHNGRPQKLTEWWNARRAAVRFRRALREDDAVTVWEMVVAPGELLRSRNEDLSEDLCCAAQLLDEGHWERKPRPIEVKWPMWLSERNRVKITEELSLEMTKSGATQMRKETTAVVHDPTSGKHLQLRKVAGRWLVDHRPDRGRTPAGGQG